jgi:hypothetical protein
MPERMMTTVVVFGGTGFLGLLATSWSATPTRPNLFQLKQVLECGEDPKGKCCADNNEVC